MEKYIFLVSRECIVRKFEVSNGILGKHHFSLFSRIILYRKGVIFFDGWWGLIQTFT